MTLGLAMRRARRLLAGGWAGPGGEPWCRTGSGAWCFEDDEGVSLFSVQGALLAAGAWPAGWYELERVLAPSGFAAGELAARQLRDGFTLEGQRRFVQLCREAQEEPDVQRWLQAEDRKLEDVLRVFTTAILRSSQREVTT